MVPFGSGVAGPMCVVVARCWAEWRQRCSPPNTNQARRQALRRRRCPCRNSPAIA